MSAPEDRLRALFRGLIARYAGAIEFWPVACLSRGELADAAAFIVAQWTPFIDDLNDARAALADLPHEPPPVVHEQVAKLMALAADLRDVFDVLLDYATRERSDIELAVLKLGFLWRELRLRVALAAAMTPLAGPLPGITADQEAYYQGILDGLFDRFTAGTG